MDLRQQVVLYTMAANSKLKAFGGDFESQLISNVQWLVLPDALEAMNFSKDLTHFWRDMTGTDTACLEFPMGEVLKGSTAKNLGDSLKYHDCCTAMECVLGNKTNLQKFDEWNFAHSNFSALRIHLIHDAIQEEVLCSDVVDVSGRFKGTYTMMSNPQRKLTAVQMKEELRRFEEQGYLYLVGKAYRQTGILFNQRWFEQYAFNGLSDSYYPKSMVDFVFEKMQIGSVTDNKINRCNFELDYDEVCKRGIMGITDAQELMSVYDRIYSWAYVSTMQNI